MPDPDENEPDKKGLVIEVPDDMKAVLFNGKPPVAAMRCFVTGVDWPLYAEQQTERLSEALARCKEETR